MFMHKSKKGFTIVELVIVIAVIAILAAVLIPTFSNLVKKANIANDTALAKNLNTSLVADEAANGKPTDFSKVLSVLRADGYIVENLNPTTAGHFFVWESESNQILLVDEQYKVVYSSKDLTDATDSINPSWFFAVKSEALIADIKANSGSVIPAVDTTWINGDGAKVTSVLKDGGVVTMNESLTITEGPKKDNGNPDGIRIGNGQDVTMNLAGQTLTAEFGAPNKTFMVSDGTFDLKDGRVIVNAEASGSGLNIYGVLNVGSDSGTNPVANIENMDIVFNSLPISQSGAAFTTGSSDAVINFKDTAITSTNALGVEVVWGTATFDNVTFKSVSDGSWNGLCVGVSYGGTATIKSGTYIAATADDKNGCCVGVLPSGGTLNISGGSFEGQLYIGTQDNNEGDSIINITGGTFEGKAFSSYTADEWKAMCVGESSNTVVVTGAGTNSVTLKVAAK